jgi:hypothetical protein
MTAPDRSASPDGRRHQLPALFGLEVARLVRRLGPLVVDEHHAVSDEDLVFDCDAVADERVALDLAVRADDCASLDLDEGTDASVVADFAAVQIGERKNHHIFAELDVVDQPVRGIVRQPIRH